MNLREPIFAKVDRHKGAWAIWARVEEHLPWIRVEVIRDKQRARDLCESLNDCKPLRLSYIDKSWSFS